MHISRALSGLLAFLALVFAALPATAADPPRKPNIVLIFADDLGWKDVGYQGSDFHETPNIDRLARDGMVFTSGYACAGNCAPSRACLLSGQYTPRHSVYAVGNTRRGPVNLMRLLPIPNKSGLAAKNVTVADALKAGGYATGIFGKWHLGGKDGAAPGEQGFDTVMARNRPGRGVQEDPKGVFAMTEAACAFMEKNKDRPFFAYVSHHAIHTPLQARKGTLKKFQAKKPGKQHSKALYAACTYDLDAGVGRLLQKVKDLGLEKDTLVVFTSDNGATNQSSQEPLRGAKGSYYEGGIRVPLIARWPGTIKPGTTCDVPAVNLDFYPTFLEAAGVPTPKGKVLDGESLLPLLRQEGSLKRQAVFWHFPGYLDRPVPRGRDPVFRTRATSVIRKGDWKMHLFHEEWVLDGGKDRLDTSRAVELYNLAEDVGERKDLATTHKDKRDELLGDLLAWFKAADALLPSEKDPAYAPGKGKKERTR